MRASYLVLMLLAIHANPVTVATITIGNVNYANANIFFKKHLNTIFLTDLEVPEDDFLIVEFTFLLDTRNRTEHGVKLQVYRPIANVNTPSFTLIAQVTVPSQDNFFGTFQLKLNESERIPVKAGDRLAILSTTDIFQPIPFASSGGVTLPIPFGNDPPKVNSTITATGIPYPIAFSLHVTLINGSEAFPSIGETTTEESPVTEYTASTSGEQLLSSTVQSTDGNDESSLPWCLEMTTRSVARLCDVTSHGCAHHCVDTPGSFQCACRKGFQLDRSDNTSCIDINECAENNGFCQHVCDDDEGSHECRCRQGYLLNSDKQTCSDIDECSDNRTCSLDQLCINTPGSFACISKSGDVCLGNTALFTQKPGFFLRLPTFVGYFVWLSLLSVIVLILFAVVGCRCQHRDTNSMICQSETPYCYDGPYNPKEEERLDQERIARHIRNRYPSLSV